MADSVSQLPTSLWRSLPAEISWSTPMATCIWPWGHSRLELELMEKYPSFPAPWWVLWCIWHRLLKSPQQHCPPAAHSRNLLINPLLRGFPRFCVSWTPFSIACFLGSPLQETTHTQVLVPRCALGKTKLRQREKNRKILEKKAWWQEEEYDWQEGRSGGKGEMRLQLSGRKKRPERKCQLSQPSIPL